MERLDAWVAEPLRPAVRQASDAEGFARESAWSPGDRDAVLPAELLRRLDDAAAPRPAPRIAALCARASRGDALDEGEIAELFAARGEDLVAVLRAADALRREVNGDEVTYVVNRNINYTNVCYFKCQFCAFSKGKLSENLRGAPYDLELAEIARRSVEAWERGATEVCMQGGIHPEYTGATYLDICRAVKDAVPEIHVHAFSPLEVWQGAATLDLPLEPFLRRLQAAGLGTLPGTAAEVLHDEVRRELCPDKLTAGQWLEVMETAHRVGFRTTATIMYGHIDRPRHWARHLASVRALQARTGGFTEFVPLPFVHMEAPIYLKGRARRGPTFRESLLMHAVARLALHPLVPNIQASWVKLGPRGVRACLQAGVNDLGGTLMNESITGAARASFGQELPPARMEALIGAAGRVPRQRSTTYGTPSEAAGGALVRRRGSASHRADAESRLGAVERTRDAGQAGARGSRRRRPRGRERDDTEGGEPMTDGAARGLQGKQLQRALLSAAAVVLVLLVGGFLAWSATCPCDYTPGGWLFGDEREEPVSDWTFANQVTLCQIQVRAGVLPHAINLNCFATRAGDLYLSCSNCDGKRWSGIAVNDGWARLRLDGAVYPVMLTRVLDPGELDRVWSARLDKLHSLAAPANPPAPLGSPRPDGWWSFRVVSRSS